MNYDVIIIGAGAAGLFCAGELVQKGKSVLVLEKNKKPGLKILISGGGRCNFTNLAVGPEHYVSENPHFCKSALRQFSSEDFINLVRGAKIAFYEKTLGQLFCKRSSKEILQLLLDRCQSKKHKLMTECLVKEVQKQEDHFVVKTQHGSFSASSLVVATGGLSFKKLGASDLGYEIAKQFGHSVVSLRPALDGFVWDKENKKYFSKIAGVSLLATVTVGKKQFSENILFTHLGLSGPAILKASLYWEPGKTVQINFIPELHDFAQQLKSAQEKHPKMKLKNFLQQHLPESFVSVLLEKLKLPETFFHSLKVTEREALFQCLSQFSFTPPKTVGYEKAEVTKGGVNVKEVSSKTMESQLVPGLFFIGEVLDVTGLLGGYNFQWAWSSAFVAARSIHGFF